jgi:hypothetical protein
MRRKEKPEKEELLGTNKKQLGQDENQLGSLLCCLLGQFFFHASLGQSFFFYSRAMVLFPPASHIVECDFSHKCLTVCTLPVVLLYAPVRLVIPLFHGGWWSSHSMPDKSRWAERSPETLCRLVLKLRRFVRDRSGCPGSIIQCMSHSCKSGT